MDREAELQLQRLHEKLASRQAEMAAQGVYPDDGEARAQCETCGDLGVVQYNVPYGHEFFGKFMPCPDKRCPTANARRTQLWEKHLASARIPDIYKQLSFESFMKMDARQRDGKMLAFEACQLFAQRRNHACTLAEIEERAGAESSGGAIHKNWLMFHGPPGTGKTGLMIALLRTLVENGESALYIRCQDLLQKVQDGYGKDAKMDAGKALKIFKQAPILLIDECNLDNITANRRDVFEAVMRHRHNFGMPTLMTANVTQREFIQMWGLRTSHVAIADAHWIWVDGSELRDTHRSVGGV